MSAPDTARLLSSYVRAFNETDEENVVQAVPNDQAEEWLLSRAPRIAVPSSAIERTYYFRLWTYRKHIKHTPAGYVITEFHPDVGWAGLYNTIPCAVGHHLREGRWLQGGAFLDDYIRFWYGPGRGHLHSYSNYLEAACEDVARVRGEEVCPELTEAMAQSLGQWRGERMGPLGLLWSHDSPDGSEFSVTGPGLRLTLNCYYYAGCRALSARAARQGNAALSSRMAKEADALYRCLERLWDDEKRFYIPLSQRGPGEAPFPAPDRRARELFGYLPWMAGAAPAGRADAFRQLTDPNGFYAAYGPTTVERRHPGFGLFYTGEELNAWLLRRGEKAVGPLGHECLWNGPSWPFATGMALTALANLLSGGEAQEAVNPSDYLLLLNQYAASHVRTREDGRLVPWIDENLNPDTGDWISRTRLMDWGGQRFPAEKGGYERGKDYNHSVFCDLVLSGLFGVRPGWDELRVTPPFPAHWPYAVLEDARVHGRNLCVYYDRQAGYRVTLDGKTVFHAPAPAPCAVPW